MGWHWWTPAGDLLLIWPAALLTAGLLARQGGRSARAVWHWPLWLGVASLLVAASKVAFYGWGTGIRAWNLSCFSGHAVLALGFWPAFLAVLVPPQRPGLRTAMVAAGLCLGLLVGLSRVTLGLHPPSEVLAGIGLGGGAAWLALRAVRGIRLPLGRGSAALAMLLAVGLWGGSRLAPSLPTEHWFRQAAIVLSGNEQPYSRRIWRQAERLPERS
ncbi:phosphatase PAP2 family protein [Luteimonas suaedae]|uniref:phosphatase PAP2 family protein n=1 Tax=Luteimonas suaedae TaxID=2605430 RepID=UPI0011EF1E7B|nr:phosphatase PAP2 family protein [Luteimonas suaedae]